MQAVAALAILSSVAAPTIVAFEAPVGRNAEFEARGLARPPVCNQANFGAGNPLNRGALAATTALAAWSHLRRPPPGARARLRRPLGRVTPGRSMALRRHACLPVSRRVSAAFRPLRATPRRRSPGPPNRTGWAMAGLSATVWRRMHRPASAPRRTAARGQCAAAGTLANTAMAAAGMVMRPAPTPADMAIAADGGQCGLRASRAAGSVSRRAGLFSLFAHKPWQPLVLRLSRVPARRQRTRRHFAGARRACENVRIRP